MFGKASIFLVLGFSGIFLLISSSLLSFGSSSVDIYVNYYSETSAGNIAVSGANLACNALYFSPTWNSGYSNLPYQGGILNVSLSTLTGGNKKITSVGKFNGIEKKVEVVMQPSSFAKFGYYSSLLAGNIFFLTGDTVWGPFHTQGKLNVKGSPVFMGKASARLGLRLADNNSNPKFYGGFESGVDIPLPDQTNTLLADASAGGKLFSASTVEMEFIADGTVKYRQNNGSWITESLTSLAPNGVIMVDRGTLRLKGTVKGKITVGVTKSSGAGTGRVFIDGDLKYSTDPTQPNCEDMLGIVATSDVLIADNAANKNGVTIHASIMCLGGGLGAENYSTIPYSGSLNLFGGIIAKEAAPIAVYNSQTGQVTNGYNKNFRYDERFRVGSPPSFPKTGNFEIISWHE